MKGLRFRVTTIVQGDELVVEGLDETGALQLVLEYKRQGKPVTCAGYFVGKR